MARVEAPYRVLKYVYKEFHDDPELTTRRQQWVQLDDERQELEALFRDLQVLAVEVLMMFKGCNKADVSPGLCRG